MSSDNPLSVFPFNDSKEEEKNRPKTLCFVRKQRFWLGFFECFSSQILIAIRCHCEIEVELR